MPVGTENASRFVWRCKMDDWDDICYECTGYGDDYSLGENGELVKNCETCPFNKQYDEWDD